MKKIISFLILAFFATLVFSQVRIVFRYQTVVRNNAGELLSINRWVLESAYC